MDELIEKLIPHRGPMVMVDHLLEHGRETATATKTFRANDYGLHEGRVIEPALIECLAQTVAAMQGASRDAGEGGPVEGMLVAVDAFEFLRPVRQDEPLTLDVRVTHRIGAFLLVDGTVRSGDAVVAKGQLKLYISPHVSDDQ